MQMSYKKKYNLNIADVRNNIVPGNIIVSFVTNQNKRSFLIHINLHTSRSP